MLTREEWENVNKWEARWWGDCSNTLGEEIKQLTYAQYMGIESEASGGKITINLNMKSVLDLGGGAVSLLLKTWNAGERCVVDPLNMPQWVKDRYTIAKIDFINLPAEDLHYGNGKFDEVWIYNVLQHVIDPKHVIDTAKKYGKTLRIFEWINQPAYKGHPHELKQELLEEWIGQKGIVIVADPNHPEITTAFTGVFNFESEQNEKI